MSRLKKFITEIHRRSLWQVLLIYVGGAWACYELIDTITNRFGLPEWLPALAAVLFLLGLPFVVATAFVREVPAPAVAPAEAETEEVAEAAAARHEARRRHRFLTWRNAAASFVVALAVWGVVAAGWLLFAERPGEIAEAGPLAAASDSRSIAVLPFENIGGAEENQAFTDGIHDDILTHLYKIGELKPIARTSVMRYRGTTKSVREIAEELGVATVLEGGVQRVDDRVRINAQLIDPETEQHLWAETYDSTLTAQNIFAIQTDIARRIATALRATLSSEEEAGIEARPTDNLEAYDHYIRGKAEVSRDFDAGVRLLERAVEIDPEFAAAWAELAWVRLGGSFIRVDIGLREPGIEALNRALELAPDAFETHMAQAIYHGFITQDLDQALENLRAAERLRPNDTEVLRRMGYAAAVAGHWDEALAASGKAVELDPLNAGSAVAFGRMNQLLGNLAEAERYYDRAIALDPSNPSFYNRKFEFLVVALGDTARAREFAEQYPERAERWLPQLHYLRRDYERALEGYLSRPMAGDPWGELTWWNPVLSVYRAMNGRERLQALADSLRPEVERYLGELIEEKAVPTQIAFVRCWLGRMYAELGDEEAAIREVKEALEVYPVSRDARNYPLILRQVANVYLVVGRHDEAIDYLEAMLSRPYEYKAAWLRIRPFYDPLRDHRRFQALLDKYE